MSKSTREKLPRYAPRDRLPPYRYVPGRNPHPLRHPNGHLRKESDDAPNRPRTARAALRFGVDLFNRAYYWEAHEVWEERWHAAADGERALLQALIQLAAGCLKQVQHGRTDLALQLFERAAMHSKRIAGGKDRGLGLTHGAIERVLRKVREDALSTAPPARRPRIHLHRSGDSPRRTSR